MKSHRPVCYTRSIWFVIFLIFVGASIVPAFAANITLSSELTYNGSNLPFNNEDTVTVTNKGQIQVAAGQTLEISGCTFDIQNDARWRVFRVEGGTLKLTNCIFKNAPKNGAINILGGKLEITGGTFSNNKSDDIGGAIRISDNASVTITNSTFSNNTATSNGGAIYSENSTVTITNSTFTNNTANGEGHGGAIYVLKSKTTIIGGTFGSKDGITEQYNNSYHTTNKIVRDFSSAYGNNAYKGGAIYQCEGELILGDENNPAETAPLFAGNYAHTDKTSTGYKPRGGAIAIGLDASLTIYNAEFYHNSAQRQAGALEIGDYFSTDDPHPSNAVIFQAKFIGNSVTNNNTEGMAGGAIMIHATNSLTMKDAAFRNNYVHVTNSDNFQKTGGGAIANCITGDSHIFQVGGAAIFDNYSNKYEGLMGKNNSITYSDVYYFHDNPDHYPQELMFTSDNHNWDYVVNTSTGRSFHQSFPTITTTEKNKIFNEAKVQFENNTALGIGTGNGSGGAIGNNGHLNIGTDLADLKIQKTWNDNSYNARPSVKAFLEDIQLRTVNDEYHSFTNIKEDTSKGECKGVPTSNADHCFTANWSANAVYDLIITVSKSTDENTWNADVYGLPMQIKDQNDQYIDAGWELTENPPANYILQGKINRSVEGSLYSFSLTNELNLVNISGSKTWNYKEATVNDKPTSYSVHLHKITSDGDKCLKNEDGMTKNITGVNPNDQSTWGSWEFQNLPKYEVLDDGTLEEITWEVHESFINHYDSERVVDENGNHNLKNTYTPNKTHVEVDKIWVGDGHNRDNTRPGSITVVLLANDNETGKTLELNAENHWSGIFKNLDEVNGNNLKIIYSVQELDIQNYLSESSNTENGYQITNTFTGELQTVTLSVNKTWDDDDNRNDTRPKDAEEILELLKSVHLYANDNRYELSDISYVSGSEYEYTAQTPAGEEVTITVDISGDSENHWTMSCSGLPLNGSDQKPISWKLTEDFNNGYSPLAIPADGLTGEWDESAKTFTYDVTNSLNDKELKIVKIWDDQGNEFGLRPDEETFLQGVSLYESGVFYDHGEFLPLEDHIWGVSAHDKVRVIIDGTDTDIWQITVKHLPRHDGNRPYEWSIEESVSGYKTTISEGNDYIITNTYTSKPKPDGPHFFRLEELPKTGFSALHPTALSAQPQRVSCRPTGLTLQIPSLDIMTNVVTVPFVDGQYPVEWIGADAGMLEGSAIPGEGYAVLTGHNHLNTTEAGPFALLSSLQEGDMVFITDENDVLKSFRVYANQKIAADDSAALEQIAMKFAGSLTLLTCEDESPEGGYISRRVVAARPN